MNKINCLFWHKRRRFCVSITVGAVVLVSLIGAAAVYYYYSQQYYAEKIDIDTAKENPILMKADRILDVMNTYFQDFMSTGSLIGINFDLVKDAEYENKVLFMSEGAEFVDVKNLKNALLSVLKNGRLFVYDDKAGFLVDGLQNIDWEQQKELMRATVFNKVDLKPVAPSEIAREQDIKTSLITILSQENQYDVWGFIRFFFMTSIEKVYVVAVCSLDDNNNSSVVPLTYIAIPKYEGIEEISRVKDGFIERLLNGIDFDNKLELIKFSLKGMENALGDDIETCLSIFIEQCIKADK